MAITKWHYTLNGQPAAEPVSAAQLKQLAASGQLKPTDLVWQDGMVEWSPAGSVKGLFPSPSPAPPERARVEGSSFAAAPPASTAQTAEELKTAKPRPPRDWCNLHPLLVLVLTLASGGVFGLFYCCTICRACSAKAAGRKSDAAGRALGQVRHPFAVLLLSYLTFGVYFYFWVSRALRECNDYLGGKEVQPRTELSLMLLFPPYALFVTAVLLPEMIRRAQTLAGVPGTPALRQAVFFLNPFLFLALPLLAMICQKSLNQIWLTAS